MEKTLLDWMSEHPVMTFFIAVLALEEIGRCVRAFGKRKDKAG